MGLFNWLFGQRPAHRAEVAPVEQVPSAGPAVYEQLADVLIDSAELRAEVKAQVARAFESPASFYDDSGEYTLADRGMMYPKSAALTPKFVFIDTLMAHNLLLEVDWKEEESEVRASVRAIMAARNYPTSIPAEDQYPGEHTYEVIQLINERELKPTGYSLQILDIQSDCYVFTIVPLAQAELVAALFAQAKH